MWFYSLFNRLNSIRSKLLFVDNIQLKKGSIKVGSYIFGWDLVYSEEKNIQINNMPYKLHFGPGLGWIKPGAEWLAIDVDVNRADILLDFNNFKRIPLEDNSVSCIYGSHVFEHISIYAAPKVFAECYRVLKPEGYFRLVLPDVKKSIEEYLKGNIDFPLFKTRMDFAKDRFGYNDFTIFEALKGDFISATGQPELLGSYSLAHQNAWDFESIVQELTRAGFAKDSIKQMSFKQTECTDFQFEGTYPSEANQDFRSIYIEVEKC